MVSDSNDTRTNVGRSSLVVTFDSLPVTMDSWVSFHTPSQISQCVLDLTRRRIVVSFWKKIIFFKNPLTIFVQKIGSLNYIAEPFLL